MSDLDGIARCRLVVHDFLARLILHDPFIKLWSYEHHTFRKNLKFGMRGCKMEHSKKFLGVVLCAFVQQPQRSKRPTLKLYDFYRASRYGTDAQKVHDFVHFFCRKFHSSLQIGFSCGMPKIRRFQEKWSSQIKNTNVVRTQSRHDTKPSWQSVTIALYIREGNLFSNFSIF